MDYNSLTAQIQAYANRGDALFVSQIPNFINQAMNRLYSEAKSLGFEKLVMGQVALNQSTINKPIDWKETISLMIVANQEWTTLLPRSLEFGLSYNSNVIALGVPKFYSDVLGFVDLRIFPTSNAIYPYTLIYRGLPLFDAANPVNFLTQRYPSLLLYACMVEAIPFMKDDERIPVFESMYNRALQNINKDKQITITDRTSKRDAN